MTPGAGAVVERDACTALADCCVADAAGALYCTYIGSNCDVGFQLELNYGCCSDYTYSGFTPSNVRQPSVPGG